MATPSTQHAASEISSDSSVFGLAGTALTEAQTEQSADDVHTVTSTSSSSDSAPQAPTRHGQTPPLAPLREEETPQPATPTCQTDVHTSDDDRVQERIPAFSGKPFAGPALGVDTAQPSEPPEAIPAPPGSITDTPLTQVTAGPTHPGGSAQPTTACCNGDR